MIAAPNNESRGPHVDPAATRVLVTGSGPAARACALGLARRGIGVVHIESGGTEDEDFGPSWILHEQSLERLERLGCGRTVADAAAVWERSRVLYKGRDVTEEPLGESASARFPAWVAVPAAIVQDALRDAVAREPSIEVVRHTTLLSALTAPDGRVRVTLQTPDAGVRSVEASYMVAADGSRSTARGCLGVAFPGATLDERYRHARVRATPRFGLERRVVLHPPGGGIGFVTPVGEGLWELAWLVDDRKSADEERRSGALDARIRTLLEGADFTVLDCDDQPLNDRHAHRPRVESVLFAGAALRSVPALGGWGVNDALEDAESAAWRLALVVRGLAPPGTLARYDQERTAATESSRGLAESILRFLVPGSWTGLTARNALLHSPFGGRARQRSVGLRLWTPSPAATTDTFDAASDAEVGLAPGAPAPDGPTALLPRRTSGRLRDHFGPGFTVLAFAKARALAIELGAWLDEGRSAAPVRRFLVVPPEQLLDAPHAPGFDAVLVDERRSVRTGFGVEEGVSAIFVVRPDGHVAARVTDLGRTSFTEVLERVTGCHLEVRESGVPMPPAGGGSPP